MFKYFRYLYPVYGLLVLGLTGIAEYRGWTLTPIAEVQNVPRTVRDNPGAYRSHFRTYPRLGGK